MVELLVVLALFPLVPIGIVVGFAIGLGVLSKLFGD